MIQTAVKKKALYDVGLIDFNCNADEVVKNYLEKKGMVFWRWTGKLYNMNGTSYAELENIRSC